VFPGTPLSRLALAISRGRGGLMDATSGCKAL
jgi:hypothetical protein